MRKDPNSFSIFTTLDSSMMFSYRNRMKALIRIILTLNHHKYKKLLQKQPSRGAPRERCSESIQPAYVPTQGEKKKKIYGRTPMPKCDFNKVALQLTLRYGCTPVNLVHIFRTPFPTNTSGGLFLVLVVILLWNLINSFLSNFLILYHLKTSEK